MWCHDKANSQSPSTLVMQITSKWSSSNNNKKIKENIIKEKDFLKGEGIYKDSKKLSTNIRRSSEVTSSLLQTSSYNSKFPTSQSKHFLSRPYIVFSCIIKSHKRFYNF